MAKRACRTADRLGLTRVPRPCRGVGGKAPPSSVGELRDLLPYYNQDPGQLDGDHYEILADRSKPPPRGTTIPRQSGRLVQGVLLRAWRAHSRYGLIFFLRSGRTSKPEINYRRRIRARNTDQYIEHRVVLQEEGDPKRYDECEKRQDRNGQRAPLTDGSSKRRRGSDRWLRRDRHW